MAVFAWILFASANLASTIDSPRNSIPTLPPKAIQEKETTVPALDLTPTPSPNHDPKEPFTLKAFVSMAVSNLAIRAAARLETAEKEKSLAKTTYLPKMDLMHEDMWSTGNQAGGLFVPMLGLIPVTGGNPSQSWQPYWGTYGGFVANWATVFRLPESLADG